MKNSNKLPQRKITTVGYFKTSQASKSDPETDTTTIVTKTLTTTHIWNK